MTTAQELANPTVRMRHALSGGEADFPPASVDGWRVNGWTPVAELDAEAAEPPPVAPPPAPDPAPTEEPAETRPRTTSTRGARTHG